MSSFPRRRGSAEDPFASSAVAGDGERPAEGVRRHSRNKRVENNDPCLLMFAFSARNPPEPMSFLVSRMQVERSSWTACRRPVLRNERDHFPRRVPSSLKLRVSTPVYTSRRSRAAGSPPVQESGDGPVEIAAAARTSRSDSGGSATAAHSRPAPGVFGEDEFPPA